MQKQIQPYRFEQQDEFLKTEVQLRVKEQNIFQDNPIHGRVALVRQIRYNGYKNLNQLNIKMRRSVKYPNLIQFKYLIFASFKNQACRDARGIVLDQNQNFKIIALPYYKFFDYDDTKYSELKLFNFSNYKIYEKHDGSLCSLYFYNGQWMVASSGVPDGQCPYYFSKDQKQQKQQKITFKSQFWKVFGQLQYKLPSQQDQNKTFVFELMSTKVTIVVKRDLNSLVLHGVRNIDTLQQQDPNLYGKKYNWNVSKPFTFQIKDKQNPIPQILQITQQLDPRKQQGFILCDDKYLRLKVKNTNYKRIHWLKQLGQTKKQQIDQYIFENVILTDEAESFITYCSQWAAQVQKIMLKLQKMNNYVNNIYEGIKNLQKKQFALQVQKQDKRIVSCLFAMRKDQNQYKNRIQSALSAAKVWDIITNMDFD